MILRRISLTIFLVCASLGQSSLSSNQLDSLINQATSRVVPLKSKPARLLPRLKPKQNWFWRHLNKIIPVGTAAGLAVIAALLLVKFRRPPVDTAATAVHPPADHAPGHGSLDDATGFGYGSVPTPAPRPSAPPMPPGYYDSTPPGGPTAAGSGVQSPFPSAPHGHGSAPTSAPLPSMSSGRQDHKCERSAAVGEGVALGLPVSDDSSARRHPLTQPGLPLYPSAHFPLGGGAVGDTATSPQAATMVAVPEGSGGPTIAALAPHGGGAGGGETLAAQPPSRHIVAQPPSGLGGSVPVFGTPHSQAQPRE